MANLLQFPGQRRLLRYRALPEPRPEAQRQLSGKARTGNIAMNTPVKIMEQLRSIKEVRNRLLVNSCPITVKD